MIERLYINNYLIIPKAEIDFTKGLNILTGETGAGKSIILDALSLLLGERADYSKIKKGKEKFIVEGYFSFKGNAKVSNLLKEILPEEEDHTDNIILRRELLSKSISRSFINDNPVSISDLKKFGDAIIDIHSQNDHQSLLDKSTHIEILDNYSDNAVLFAGYIGNFNELKALISDYSNLIEKKDELSSKIKYLDHELKEINNLNLVPMEDIELEKELNRLENVESISNGLKNTLSVLYEDEFNSMSQTSIAIKELRKIIDYDTVLQNIFHDLENSYTLIKESSESLNSYRHSLNFDEGRIEHIRNRLTVINHLKKKYNLSIDELIERGIAIQKELSFVENYDFETSQILNKINSKRKIVFNLAKEINKLRKKSSKELEMNINALFRDVGLETAEFKVTLENTIGSNEELLCQNEGNENYLLGNKGFNELEFLIKTNKGSEFTPIRKTASGGEISRIMLAIKTALSEKDSIGILVFDEIDAGISGRIAQKVGSLLKNLSKTHQVICITHLPQIAAKGSTHFRVSKEEKNSETIALIKCLDEKEKVSEIAKLISGEKITEISMKGARELIKN